MHFAVEVLSKTNCLSEELQSSTTIVSNAAELIEATYTELLDMRSDPSVFTLIYDKSVEFAAQFSIDDHVSQDVQLTSSN